MVIGELSEAAGRSRDGPDSHWGDYSMRRGSRLQRLPNTTPQYPWSLSTFPPCLTLLHYSPLLCFLVDFSACFVCSSASLSTPLHPCLLLCIRIYSSASLSTPLPPCLLLCMLVDSSASLCLLCMNARTPASPFCHVPFPFHVDKSSGFLAIHIVPCIYK